LLRLRCLFHNAAKVDEVVGDDAEAMKTSGVGKIRWSIADDRSSFDSGKTGLLATRLSLACPANLLRKKGAGGD
jgi:hypothetical protein